MCSVFNPVLTSAARRRQCRRDGRADAVADAAHLRRLGDRRTVRRLFQNIPVGESLRPGKFAGREHPHPYVGDEVWRSRNADRDEPEAIFRRDGMQGGVRGASEALPVVFGKECGNEGRLSSASRHDRGHGFSAGCPDAVAEVPLEVRGTQRMVRPLGGNGMQGGARGVANVGATHFDHVRGAQGMVINGGHRPGGHHRHLRRRRPYHYGADLYDK